jgi:hypothetical protein
VTFEAVAFTTDEVGNRGFSEERSFVLDYTDQAGPTTVPTGPTTPPAASTPTPQPAPASAVPGGADAPELANTGSSSVPCVATALLLIAVGLGLTRLSRRVAAAAR